MNGPDHMHPVRDYFIYIDVFGNVWKLQPTWEYHGCPFRWTLIHKA